MIPEDTVTTTKARARDYLRARGTDASTDEVRTKITDAFEALDTFLASVPADRVARRAWPHEWSIQEIVDHLLETHRPGLDELRCLLAGQEPPGEPIPASLQSKAPLLRPWPWLLRELADLHAEIVEGLASASAGFESAARASLVMVVNVKDDGGATVPLEWVEHLDWKAYALVWRLHVIDHMHQARRVLAALA